MMQQVLIFRLPVAAQGLVKTLALMWASSVCAFMLGVFLPSLAQAKGLAQDYESILASSLPREAQQTLATIQAGGPFPYPKDGVVFGNREKLLPKQARGYYTEYTVKTPGASNRGARRIVVGGAPRSSNEKYYSDDHYQSFKRIRE